MRKVIRVLLQREGYAVLEAGDGHSALQLQSAHAPDLILTELALPDISGVELARRLRAQSGGAGVPIIALSDPQRDVPPSADALFASRLVKPVSPDCLRQAVQVCLSHGGGERDRVPERETR